MTRLGVFSAVYMTCTILTQTLIVILPLKALLGRDRPQRIKSVRRICNMRDIEHGKSMPSGDAAACAFFCASYWYLFGFTWFGLICVPFCALGRVYTHCHWIGDTIVGAMIGILCSGFFYREENY